MALEVAFFPLFISVSRHHDLVHSRLLHTLFSLLNFIASPFPFSVSTLQLCWSICHLSSQKRLPVSLLYRLPSDFVTNFFIFLLSHRIGPLISAGFLGLVYQENCGMWIFHAFQLIWVCSGQYFNSFPAFHMSRCTAFAICFGCSSTFKRALSSSVYHRILDLQQVGTGCIKNFLCVLVPTVMYKLWNINPHPITSKRKSSFLNSGTCNVKPAQFCQVSLSSISFGDILIVLMQIFSCSLDKIGLADYRVIKTFWLCLNFQ